VYEFRLDSKDTTKIPMIWVTQGDTESNVFLITLTDSGKKLDLTGQTITFTFRKSDGNIVNGNATLVEANVVRYVCGTNEIAAPGPVSVTVEVYDALSRLTFTRFKFYVRPQLDDGTGVPSTTEYPILVTLMEENQAIQDVEALRVTAENTRETNTNAAILGANTAKDSANSAATAANNAAQSASTAATAATSAANSATTAASSATTAAQAANEAKTSADTATSAANTAAIAASNAATTANNATDAANTATQSALDAVDAADTATAAANSATTAANNAATTANNTNTSIQTAETSRVTAESSRASTFAQMITDQHIILKSPVATFAAIATTYPTPSVGWTTRVTADSKVYRYDGTSWVWIDTLTVTSYDAILAEVTAPKYLTDQKIETSIGSLPANTVKSQFSDVQVKGNSVTVLYGAVAERTILAGASDYPTIKTALNLPAGNYLIFYEIVQSGSNNLNSPFLQYDDATQYYENSGTNFNTGIGRKVWKATTTKVVTSLRWGAVAINSDIKIRNFMIILADAATFAKTSAELLAQYSFLFTGTKSTFSAGGRLKSVGKNLLNVNDSLKRTYIDTATNSLKIETTDGWETTVPFKITPIQSYTYSGFDAGVGSSRMLFLDSNKNTISSLYFGTGALTKYVPVIPSNASFVQVSYRLDKKNTVQFELGTAATPYEPYTESSAYIPAKEGGYRSLPNGTKDEVNAVIGEQTKRVGSKVLQASDITAINIVSYTNGDTITIAKPSDSLSPTAKSNDIKHFTIGEYTNIAFADNVSNINTAFEGSVSYGLFVQKGTYADLAAAQAALVGKTLTYQLTVPVVTKVAEPQSLMAQPNGTVYVEPKTTDYGWYQAGFAIAGTTPIKAITQVIKLDLNTGDETPIALSSVVLTSRTITSTALADNDFVWVEYEYDSTETTIPTTTYSVAINMKAQVEDNSKAVVDLRNEVNDLDFRMEHNIPAEAVNAQTLGGLELIYSGVELYISRSGIDTNDGSEGSPIKSIQHAFDLINNKRLANGAINIYVEAGDYSVDLEPGNVSKDTHTLEGVEGQVIIFGAGDTTILGPIFVYNCEDIYFSDFKVVAISSYGSTLLSMYNVIDTYTQYITYDANGKTNVTAVSAYNTYFETGNVCKIYNCLTAFSVGRCGNISIGDCQGNVDNLANLFDGGVCTLTNGANVTITYTNLIKNLTYFGFMVVDGVVIHPIPQYTDQGTDPDYTGVQYKLVVVNGQLMLEVVKV
jgi:hypothetical protein